MTSFIVSAIWSFIEPLIEAIPTYTFNPDISLSPALVCLIFYGFPLKLYFGVLVCRYMGIA